ncbi:WhiB family transcriptional regulator [Pseudonocardia sp. KRD-291]|nr:WhiB family transcriptional regulator [Pseudonocardia sp. KRD291]
MVGRGQTISESRDWRARAACCDVDGELFFPAAEAGPELERAEASAKRVCAGCPVRSECLAWAMESLPFGVAGGLGEAERVELRRIGRLSRRVRRTPATLPVPTRSPSNGRASLQREAGTAALAAGRDRDRVAAECGVSRRTVDRWAAALRTDSVRAGVGGAR